MASKKEIKYLKDNFDLKNLYDIGFFSKLIDPMDYDSQIERICGYFGISNIFQFDIIDIDMEKFLQPDLKTFSKN